MVWLTKCDRLGLAAKHVSPVLLLLTCMTCLFLSTWVEEENLFVGGVMHAPDECCPNITKVMRQVVSVRS